MLRNWLREDGAYWTVCEVKNAGREFFELQSLYSGDDKGLRLVILKSGFVRVQNANGESLVGGSRMLLHTKGYTVEYTDVSPDADALFCDIIPSREAPIGDSLYDMYDKYPQYRRYCQNPSDILVFDDSFGLVYSTVQALMKLNSDKWIFSRLYAYYIMLVITCFSDDSSKLRPGGNRYVRKAVKYIYDNCATPITPRDVARDARVNSSHLRKLFDQETGCAPGEYIARMRLDRVKFLLIHTDFSISEIARLVGFSSGQYLSGVFKKRMGQSIREFKNSYNVTCGYDTLEGYDTKELPEGFL